MEVSVECTHADERRGSKEPSCFLEDRQSGSEKAIYTHRRLPSVAKDSQRCSSMFTEDFVRSIPRSEMRFSREKERSSVGSTRAGR